MVSSDPLDLSLGLSPSASYNQNDAVEETGSDPSGPPGLKPFVFNLEQKLGHQAPQPDPSMSFEQMSKKRRRSQVPVPKPRSSGGSPPESKKSESIMTPYPWSTDKRCKVRSVQELMHLGIMSISGRVKCKKCEQAYEMSFDLNEKMMEVGHYIMMYKDELRDRAPAKWMNPVLPRCRQCGQENSMKPEMEGKKKNINWLFLFLGEMLGCCTGQQLKYFCKYNGQHRTAAKDRLLFLAYVLIFNQL